MPVARVPAFTVIVVCAPAASAGTFTVPTFVPPIATTAVVAAEPAVPEFRTVAPTEIGLRRRHRDRVRRQRDLEVGARRHRRAAAEHLQLGDLGVGRAVFAVNTRRTSVADPLTGTVTVLPDDGLNA